MLEDTLYTFTKELCRFLTGNEKEVKGMLVKKHSVDLHNLGEFSFPNTVKSWYEYVDIDQSELGSQSLLKCLRKETNDIVESSKRWKIQVKEAVERKDRIHLYLNRIHAIKVGLSNSLLNNNLFKQPLSNKTCYAHIEPDCEGHCTTYLRLKCMKYVINNFIAVCSILKDYMPELSNIIITSKSSSINSRARSILCGTVLNVKTNVKETSLSGDEFIRLRQNELTLIAKHKYGVRVSTECKWKEFIAHLGESAVTFELLQTKPSSAVKINFDASSGSSKGAAFVLYNCARLETILRTYNERVNDGTYPPLPDFEETDFSLLIQEEEWCLIFNYILGLPLLLKSCVEVHEHAIEFRPHLLCGFLSSMVKLISQYYRKTRVLTEPRKHLLPVMFARLHMLNILNETLKTCLRILNIKSVSQMYNAVFYCDPNNKFIDSSLDR